MTKYALALIALALLPIMLSAFKWQTTIASFVLATLCVLPGKLLGSSTPHVGIAGSEPQIMTFGAVLMIATIVGLLIGKWKQFPISLLPFCCFQFFCIWFVWPGTLEQWAGVLHFCVAICGSYVGVLIGEQLQADSGFRRFFARGLLSVVILQLIVSLLQFVGVSLFPTDSATAELMGSRVNGTFNHPTALGKMLVLIMILSLPLTRAKDVLTRRAASSSLFIGFVPLALSGGRANFLGALMMVIIWTLILPRTNRLSGRLWLLFGVLTAAIASSGIFLARFEEDPTGGARQRLSRIALERIPTHPLTGVGPNSYVSAIGPFDSLVAQGWLVHNVVLLSVVELGLLGATLLVTPLVWAAIKSWGWRTDPGIAGDYARSYLVSMPAIAVIGGSGWGLMHQYTLPLWFLTTGVCIGVIQAARHKRTANIPGSLNGRSQRSMKARGDVTKLFAIRVPRRDRETGHVGQHER